MLAMFFCNMPGGGTANLTANVSSTVIYLYCNLRCTSHGGVGGG